MNEKRSRVPAPTNERVQERKRTDEEAPWSALQGRDQGTDEECPQRTLSTRQPPVEERTACCPRRLGGVVGEAKPPLLEEHRFSGVTIAEHL